MPSSSYAAQTTVSASKSMGEILGLFARFGVTKTMSANDENRCHIMFEYKGVPYRISISMPDPADKKFTHTDSRAMRRTEKSAREMYEKEINRLWRVLVAVIKAKLVAVEEGVSTIEAEFIGNVMLPGGRTVSEQYSEDLPALAASGAIHPLALPGVSE